MKSIRFLIVALSALALPLAVFAADPSGTWKFTAEGPNGRSTESVLTLNWANQQLTGTIDNRAGKAEIKNATFADDVVKFTVERKIRRRSFKTHYTGRLEGDTIKGTIQATGRKKSSGEIPWLAERAK
jgi:hypothetical protein